MSLARLYDELCAKADALLKKHNPCQWNPKTRDCARKTKGCCKGCTLLNKKTGCTIKSLACKLWICPEISATLPDNVIREFRRLWDTAQEHNLLTFRGGAQESVRNAKRPNAGKRYYSMVHKYGESTHIFTSDRIIHGEIRD